MPTLTWPNKDLPAPKPVSPFREAVIYPQGSGYPQEKPSNRLYRGENLGIMAALLPEYEGKIDLIYADPPFYTNRQFHARIGRGEDSRKPKDWLLAEGYGDHWDSLDDYIQFLYERLSLMHSLLSPTGTIYLHLDWHADAYARLLLDEIFGADHLLNEIIWAYHGPSPIRSAFNRKHDTILAYIKDPENYTFNADAVRVPYDEATVKTFASSKKAGFGKIPDLQRGKVPEDWWYFPVVARLHNERTGYPTQKPEVLLERIIQASCNPADLVADFFCGSGTTPLAAARLGRRFIASDATFRAIHTATERLVREKAAPFEIWNTEKTPSKTGDDFQFEVTPEEITITTPENVHYWEIDPDFDGQTFHSTAQAVLPVRGGELPLSLPLPQQKTGCNLCIRLITNQGEEVRVSTDRPAPSTH
jgi:DNA modification methylase